MEKDFVCIYSTTNELEAEIIKGMLINNDIVCVILKKQDSPYQLFGNLELYVHNSNIEEATLLLKQENE
ncbi:MAG: putative signal transducing protein [Mangrovibacterium sp.]